MKKKDEPDKDYQKNSSSTEELNRVEVVDDSNDNAFDDVAADLQEFYMMLQRHQEDVTVALQDTIENLELSGSDDDDNPQALPPPPPAAFTSPLLPNETNRCANRRHNSGAGAGSSGSANPLDFPPSYYSAVNGNIFEYHDYHWDQHVNYQPGAYSHCTSQPSSNTPALRSLYDSYDLCEGCSFVVPTPSVPTTPPPLSSANNRAMGEKNLIDMIGNRVVTTLRNLSSQHRFEVVDSINIILANAIQKRERDAQ